MCTDVIKEIVMAEQSGILSKTALADLLAQVTSIPLLRHQLDTLDPVGFFDQENRVPPLTEVEDARYRQLIDKEALKMINDLLEQERPHRTNLEDILKKVNKELNRNTPITMEGFKLAIKQTTYDTWVADCNTVPGTVAAYDRLKAAVDSITTVIKKRNVPRSPQLVNALNAAGLPHLTKFLRMETVDIARMRAKPSIYFF